MRPTGRLHLGNYEGALKNWVRLQDSYQCYYFVADWHALTSDYADTSAIKGNTMAMVTTVAGVSHSSLLLKKCLRRPTIAMYARMLHGTKAQRKE